LVDKPLGWTSFDTVNKIRFSLARELELKPKQIKVGHAGTLDPLATGLLIVLVGRYTKRQGQFMKLDKTYEAQVTLGSNSTTDDAEGALSRVSSQSPPPKIVTIALKSFLGRQLQIPPRFSAVKVRGQRAYVRASKGQEIELEPRPVTIISITDINYHYPVLNFTCRVSSGTYIRSLARDLGAKLGTGAYLSGLRRSHIGGYKLDQALSLDQLDNASVQASLIELS